VVLVAVLTGAVALADNTVPDGDGVVPVDANPMSFGDIDCGHATSDDALIAISRNGSATATNTFKNSATVTITVVSTSGAGLSAVAPSSTITLASDWTSLANNTRSSAVASSVTVNSSTPGAGSGTVTYRATGLNSSGSTINRDAVMSVSWNVRDNCNAGPSVDAAITGSATANEGDTKPYSIGATDPDGDTLGYAWSITAGNAAIAGSSSSSSISVDFTDGPSTVGLRAVVSDGHGHEVTRNLSITESNVAPSAPGAPLLSSGTNPNKTGVFSLGWLASTDVGDDTFTYTLEHRDNNDAAYSSVAGGLSLNSYAFSGSGEPEGTWTYRARAIDSDGDAGASSTASAPIVVDKTPPNAPASSTSPAAAYNDGTSDWYKDSVTVSFAGTGDPPLADGSDGSGVASVTANHTFDGLNVAPDGSFSRTGTATDGAGNVSSGTAVTGKVDYAAPTVSFSNCPATVLLNSTGAVNWTAADSAPSSGLATAASGSVNLATSAAGPQSVSVPAGTVADNVGHGSAKATCSYTVVYTFTGFFQPVDNKILNGMKAGSTAPIKWQLTDANGSYVSSLSAVSKVESGVMPCSASVPVDNLEEYATGATALRYDSTTNQYVYNWQSPKKPGSCYQVKIAFNDGTSQVAMFQLK
jgi:hypothetical protein